MAERAHVGGQFLASNKISGALLSNRRTCSKRHEQGDEKAGPVTPSSQHSFSPITKFFYWWGNVPGITFQVHEAQAESVRFWQHHDALRAVENFLAAAITRLPSIFGRSLLVGIDGTLMNGEVPHGSAD
jgi:hypothetical protein